MKLVEAIIKPAKVDEVKLALEEMGVEEIMETEVITHNHSCEGTMTYRGARYVVDMITRVRVDVVAADDLVAKVVKAIRGIAETGRREDCRILVLDYVEAY
ncbi:P-II family nitrogen regulator [Geomesophilobacter sediminis]|uniref:P-II family nitrogen regulator n=1 Tax=Geomesophilobacter sediminis TaxID=2798584 RepID=A0A8J7IXC0_9BACT|nr:P-II family nitrogen regulator [Geomesophilobacter sediminis]MBJ6724487.1 P-II family nitrogen regulator [Geomesophilobacter sediminis]